MTPYRALRSLAADALTRMRGRSARSLAVLMYHSVGDDGAFFTVRPAAFAAQMAHLARHAAVLPLGEALERLYDGSLPQHAVALTFDDGYRNNLTHALPVLERHQLPATVFVATGLLGGERTLSDGITLPMLAEHEARALAEHPLITLAPHTVSHPRLTELSDASLADELQGSADDVSRLGGDSTLFAYPYGAVDARVADAARRRFAYAVTVKRGFARPSDDPLLIPRLAVDSAVSFSRFRLKI